ncbi:MAG: 2-oxoacid:ferredoxin oxidoreductase subunit beta [Actinomycetia bacterium]|nr:2-oxoacid:ferredoxin oxidoreductase subunit beta [Actinomycetes bacterium]
MNKKETELKPEDFNTHIRPTWCLGCGNYGIWNAMKRALVTLGLKNHQVLAVYGIGCSGNGTNFTKTYAFHSLHGRSLPVATGAKLANHKLNVIVMAGDGDGAGIGGNHFMHTCRRNIDITFIMHDNRIYGLTTGQASPTSDQGFKSKSTPKGVLEEPVNPIALALSSGATFVARGFSGQVKHLSGLMVEAIKHNGFSFVDVLQPCVTFNKKNTYEWYRDRVYKLEDEPDYKSDDLMQAFEKSQQKDKIPIGIFYKIDKPTYEDGLKQIERKPLVDHVISDVDINKLLNEYF